MSKNRLKTQLPVVTTRQEAEATVAQITNLTIERIKTTALMDAAIAAARARYEPFLATAGSELHKKTEALRGWAEAHPEEFPPKRKSLEFVQGTIGFRTGTPQLKLLSRSWSWAKVLECLNALRWRRFIRVKREPDKEAILARAAAAKDPDRFQEKTLSRIGVKVSQEESFYVEPKLTEIEARQTAEAA